MKSLNPNRKDGSGIPFDNQFFTPEIVKHILDEGFDWKETNDSYGTHRDLTVRGCYKKFAGHNHGDWPIYVYICEDGIEVDNDYECGGNCSSVFFPFERSFEETYDDMVNCVNALKEY